MLIDRSRLGYIKISEELLCADEARVMIFRYVIPLQAERDEEWRMYKFLASSAYFRELNELEQPPEYRGVCHVDDAGTHTMTFEEIA